jgi:predicted RND superfamily exporter protein
VAVGVLCAFLIMTLLVPAARIWRDRDRRVEGRAARTLDLARAMDPLARFADRLPWAGLVGAGVLVALSLLAATGLDIEFERDDFVPEGSDIATSLAEQQELFGGGVTESTFVVMDGDLETPAVMGAMQRAQGSAASIDGVRSVGGQPQVTTRMAADGSSAVVQLRTTTGDSGAERVRRELEAAFAPVTAAGADLTVTSEPIIIAEMSDDLATFQAQAIAVTLAVVLVLLAGYYTAAHRRPLLGVLAMIPATISASLVLGTMWLLDISFNVITATMTAIAVGIGVPYGVHVVNRFVEDLEEGHGSPIARTLRGTGGALTGSALTTLGAFVVLAFSSLPPIRSLGLLGGLGIAFALLAAVLVEPGALVLWHRWHLRRSPDHERRDGDERSPALTPS